MLAFGAPAPGGHDVLSDEGRGCHQLSSSASRRGTSWRVARYKQA